MRANLIVSTTHNNQALNQAIRQVAKRYLDGHDADRGAAQPHRGGDPRLRPLPLLRHARAGTDAARGRAGRRRRATRRRPAPRRRRRRRRTRVTRPTAARRARLGQREPRRRRLGPAFLARRGIARSPGRGPRPSSPTSSCSPSTRSTWTARISCCSSTRAAPRSRRTCSAASSRRGPRRSPPTASRRGVVLGAFEATFGRAPPPAFELAIRGERFDLGEPLGERARLCLEAALAFFAALRGDARPSLGRAWSGGLDPAQRDGRGPLAE